MYYRSNETGKIIPESAAKILEDIYGEGAIDVAIKLGTLSPIEAAVIEGKNKVD